MHHMKRFGFNCPALYYYFKVLRALFHCHTEYQLVLSESRAHTSKQYNMTRYTPDLARTLIEVPELRPTCLSSWESRGVGIRELRLVSKQIASTALQAVQSFSMQIGDWAYPDVAKLVLLTSLARLKDLTVTVLIQSGEKFG